MEIQPLSLVKEITNGLQTADSKEEITKWLTIIRALFAPRFLNDNNRSLYGYDYSTLLNIRDVFTSQYAKRIYEKLISRFSVEWISELTIDVFNSYVLPIFLEGPHKDSFIVLLNTITDSEKKEFGVYKCVLILEKFVCRNTLTHLLCNECKRGGSLHSYVLDVDAEILLGYLSSFSEKVANKLQLENSEVFLPQNYIPTLALAVLDTLQWAHDLLVKSQDVSLLFVSSLVGKICLTGYADFLLDTLLPHISIRVRTDYIWCRICERVFAGVPDRCLESVVVPLLKKVSWYGLIDKFLGDCVVHNAGIKMLICTKLLLYRCYPKPKQLLQNIIGYLISFHSRRHLFVEVILSLIKVWSDRSSMKHISAEQHLYITRALMVCTGALNDQEKNNLKGELLQTLIHGVEAHLESSDPTVRTLGMTVAKTLTHAIDPLGPQLEFDLDLTNQAVVDLLSYRELPEDSGLTLDESALMDEINAIAVSTTEKQTVSCESMSVEQNTEKIIEESDLDSDDDLEPYDMSNDIKVTKSTPPKYVRECMEGLICSSEDPDKTEICLQHAEALIRRKTTDLDEIAVEFAKILLHLENTHSFDNFLMNRFSALVAVTVNCPHKVAEYLSSQFYERNYSSRQRMDILEVLANAAQELSQPEKTDLENRIRPSSDNKITPDSGSSGWKEVVQRRIESNTQRFARGRTKPEQLATLNKFTQVAGQFFYPLMAKADKGQTYLDLMGTDNMLLFKLLYTLAIILHSAINLPCASHMGQALLEFTWPLRFHSDSSVRQAVLISTISVILVTPPHLLMTDLQADMTETTAWLEGVIDRDPDTECQKWATQALLLLREQIKKEMANSSKS